MKDLNCHDPKWRGTANWYVALKINLTVSNSTTLRESSTRPRMNWQRWHRCGPRSPRTYSPETCTSPRWTMPRQHKRAHRPSHPQGPRRPLLPRPRRPSPRPWKSMQSLPKPTRGRTGGSPSLIASFEECFLRTGPRPNGSRDEPKLMSSATASYTDEAHLASSNDASPPRKAKPYFGTCMREPAGTMLRLGRSSEMLFAKGSTGQWLLLTPPSSYTPTRDASTMHGRHIS